MKRATNVAWRILASVGVLVVIAFIRASVDPGLALLFGSIAAAAVLGWIIGLGIGAVITRGRLSKMRELAPNEFVFVFKSSPEFAASVLAIAPDTDPRYPPVSLRASASREGLSLWDGQPPHKFGFIPWGWVMSVQQDTISVSRTVYPCVLLSIKNPADGKIVALPLPNANADLLPLPSKAEAIWIADELNGLRTEVTTARLI